MEKQSIVCKKKEEECQRNGPILEFLKRRATAKQLELEASDASKLFSEESTIDEIEEAEPSFAITSYSISDSVEYDVVMTKSVPINGRSLTSNYKFKTRYSKLLKLHQSLGPTSLEFPEKKMFGSKSPAFIKKRMV